MVREWRHSTIVTLAFIWICIRKFNLVFGHDLSYTEVEAKIVEIEDGSN